MAELEEAPIVVYGAPRSGTTYLEQLLNQHPEVFITRETRVFVWAHRSLATLTNEFYAAFHRREEFQAHLAEEYPELIRSFYRKLNPEARFWGDKNPHYASPRDIGCLDTILSLFPRAKFVHIVRDGRAVVMSVMRKGWETFDTAHRWWTGYVELGSSFGRRLPPSQYFELRHEDLLADDLAMAERLFDFLEIGLDPAVVSFCERQQSERTPINRPTSDLLAATPETDWEKLLAPDQRLRSLERLEGLLVQYGYESEESIARVREELARSASGAPLDSVRHAVRESTPESATVVVVSDGDDRLVMNLDGRTGWHFPQTPDNVYDAAGVGTSSEAIAHLQDLCRKGASFLLIPRRAFVWLDRFSGFYQHLESEYTRVHETADCLLYRLTRKDFGASDAQE